MEYPKWLEHWIESLNHDVEGGSFPRVIEMAKDAWEMAFNSGVEGTMSPAEFCAKYGDMPYPNDGSPV